ncbi:type II toxin-antitoxin system ParD family antitoxin [Maribacter sp. TH_r10]|uniref:type II toxin-antitoxin system ParD family antitoxin n=1 Tax=Maribacter sp. TH_r10 TaxID=3082086 RepID=UPI00398876DE
MASSSNGNWPAPNSPTANADGVALYYAYPKRYVQFDYVTKIWYFLGKIIVKMGKNTSISRGNHFEDFIREEVNSCRYRSVSEVIRSALRLLEHEEKKERELIKALEVGENSGFDENLDPQQHLKELHHKHL